MEICIKLKFYSNNKESVKTMDKYIQMLLNDNNYLVGYSQMLALSISLLGSNSKIPPLSLIPSLVAIRDLTVSVFSLFLSFVLQSFSTLNTLSTEAFEKGKIKSKFNIFFKLKNTGSPMAFLI